MVAEARDGIRVLRCSLRPRLVAGAGRVRIDGSTGPLFASEGDGLDVVLAAVDLSPVHCVARDEQRPFQLAPTNVPLPKAT
jgi:hypothetical protein